MNIRVCVYVYFLTFIPVWPLLRIDYILVPGNVECVEHIIHKMPFSDHYPVTAEVVI